MNLLGLVSVCSFGADTYIIANSRVSAQCGCLLPLFIHVEQPLGFSFLAIAFADSLESHTALSWKGNVRLQTPCLIPGQGMLNVCPL